MSSSSHNVYLIISKKRGFYKTYVGYAKNIRKRIQAHNSNKGAKSTKGRNWKLIYKKNLKQKVSFKIRILFKKNRKLRNNIKEKYIKIMDKKLIVKVAAGLGNQMFMYANAFSLSKRFNYKLLIDNTSGFFQSKKQNSWSRIRTKYL